MSRTVHAGSKAWQKFPGHAWGLVLAKEKRKRLSKASRSCTKQWLRLGAGADEFRVRDRVVAKARSAYQ